MSKETDARLLLLERRQSQLVKFGQKLAGVTRLEPLLDLLAAQVKQILGVDRCSIFLVDEHRKEVWSKVAHGLKGRELRMPLGEGIVGHVAKYGEALMVGEAYKDRRFSQEVDQLTGYKTQNVLAVPLKDNKGKVLGVFEVLNKHRGMFDDEDEGLLRLLASIASSAIDNAQLYESLRRSHLETIYRLALTAEFRDQEDTAAHLQHISRYSKILALHVGLSDERAEELQYASPLHDIGKVAISDAILKKTGKYTPEEYEEMKKHTYYGWKILDKAETPLLRMACSIALTHHERFDGKGYPKGLKEDEIPLESQIVSVVDVFDALMSERVYKRAWTLDETCKYLKSQSGQQFAPSVVSAFFKGIDEIKEALEEHQTLHLP